MTHSDYLALSAQMANSFLLVTIFTVTVSMYFFILLRKVIKDEGNKNRGNSSGASGNGSS